MGPTVAIGNTSTTIVIVRMVAISCLIHLCRHHLVEEHLHLLELLERCHLVLLLVLVGGHESMFLGWNIVRNIRWCFG